MRPGPKYRGIYCAPPCNRVTALQRLAMGNNPILAMNSLKIDDLEFKFLAAVIISGVIFTLVALLSPVRFSSVGNSVQPSASSSLAPTGLHR